MFSLLEAGRRITDSLNAHFVKPGEPVDFYGYRGTIEGRSRLKGIVAIKIKAPGELIGPVRGRDLQQDPLTKTLSVRMDGSRPRPEVSSK